MHASTQSSTASLASGAAEREVHAPGVALSRGQVVGGADRLVHVEDYEELDHGALLAPITGPAEPDNTSSLALRAASLTGPDEESNDAMHEGSPGLNDTLRLGGFGSMAPFANEANDPIDPALEAAREAARMILHKHRKSCPHTYQMVRKLALLQPSSAMAERIFSMLQAYFPQMGRRTRCYQDFILLCMQLNAHYRSVHPGAL